jgi:hypothetical protein
LQTTPIQKDFVNAVAAEMVTCVDKAVECWMAEFESALENPRLTTLGRLQAMGEVLARYKHLTGKTQLRRRSN